MSKIDKFTKDELSVMVQNAKYWKDFHNILGYINPMSGYQPRIKRNIENVLNTFKIDYSHLKGVGWNKNVKLPYITEKQKIHIDDILIENSTYTGDLKRRLKEDLGWKHECTKCKLSIWLEKPIPLELEHINGNHFDNRIENLTFLCCNCHAFTDTWRVNKTKKEKTVYKCTECSEEIGHKSKICVNCFKKQTQKSKNKCLDCNEEIRHTTSKRCIKCYKVHNQKLKTKCIDCDKTIKHLTSKRCIICHKIHIKLNIPSLEQLKNDLTEFKYYTRVGEKYDVSDNAVRRWAKNYKLL